MKEWLTRLRFLLFRKKRTEFDDELRYHLERSIADKRASGLNAAEARRQALIEFGSVEYAREECEQQRPGWWFSTVLQDVRYAVRGFRRSPTFTIGAIMTLALGIASTTAVFSVVDRVLFRTLPYSDPERLVSVGITHSLEHQEFLMGRLYLEWRDRQTPFVALASQSAGTHACDLVENNPAQLDCISFEAGLLPLLGVSPQPGRNFLPEEDQPNGPHVAIISHALWKQHYGGDPNIVDHSIDIDGLPTRVVGVLPKNFQFPTLESADVIFPMKLDRTKQHTLNGGFGIPMRTFARLKPGVTISQAHAQMQPIFDSEQNLFPPGASKETHLGIRSLRDRETAEVRPVAWILLGAVAAVLLIACANVAGLLVARGAARQREIAVRSALGASRARLIRQALTEALLLSLSAAVIGSAIAQGLLTVFIALAPPGIAFLGQAHIDLRIAAFTVLLSMLCGIFFGLVPALQTPGLLALSARTSLPRTSNLLRHGLVVGQVSVSILLLSAAALLLRSFQKIQQQNLGMQTGGVLTARVALPSFRYDTEQKEMDFYLRAEAALRRLPGIRAVGIADCIPPGGWQGEFRFADLAVEGKAHFHPGTGGTLVARRVTPDYFHALNIPVLRGRGFTEEDRTSNEQEIMLSSLLAQRLFPGEDPIGKRVQRLPEKTWYTVAGVAGNVKNSGLTEQDDPEIYFLRRNFSEDWLGPRAILLIDSVLPTSMLVEWVRSQITALDPTVPIETEPLKGTIVKLAAGPRFETALIGFFAFMGLVMAVVGLYGVIAFLTSRRTQEIGVRMALGATRASILSLIAKDGMRLVVVGAALGLAIALAMSRVLKSLLFEISNYDPLTYVAVAIVLCLVALVAILVPARRGMKVDPAVALRNE